MPHFPVVNDRLQLRVWCADAEQAAVNTFYFKVYGITNNPTDQMVADHWATTLKPLYTAILNNDSFFQGVQVRIDNRLPLPVQANAVDGFPGAGTAGTPGLSRQTCGLITFRTDVAGPRGRGRTYLPFPAVADQDVPDGPVAGYRVRAAAIVTALEGTGGSTVITSGADVIFINFVHWSKKYGTMDLFTPSTVSTKWATLRKRGSFGRANASPV